MRRWVAVLLALSAAASFAAGALTGAHRPAAAGGALVGAHRTAAAGRALAGAHRTAAAGGASGLARSTVSADRVQRQPRPGACHARGRGLYSLPDRRCTPGAIDPVVTQSDIGRTICRDGYSDSVRPPESVTEPEKRASLRAYGDRRPLHDYEYDHLVALELGGAVNDPRNLWPEPGASPNLKDGLEDHLHALVCERRLTLATAQLAIARDWVAAGRRYGR